MSGPISWMRGPRYLPPRSVQQAATRRAGEERNCPLDADHQGREHQGRIIGTSFSFQGRNMMKLPRRNFLHLAAGAAALPAVSRIARAQAYPSRPVRLI